MAVLDAPSVDLSGEPRARAFDPVFALSAAVTFVTLFAAAELASRIAVRTGFWYSRVDPSGTLTSGPELEERIRWAASRRNPIFLLGDSVIGASALLEHGAAAPRRRTLAASLEDQERSQGRHVESLGADGMLLPDLEAESRLVSAAASASGDPRRSLVVLNFRMFASEFQEPAKSRSREFLDRAHSETTLGERALRASALFRTTAMLKSLWYFPTRRDFFRRTVERVLGSDSDPEIQEAALRLKVAPYYRARWSLETPAFRALDALVRELAPAGPVDVVLAPQNPDFVEDAQLFAEDRAVLADFFRARPIPGVEYRDLAALFPSDRFLDHCHLTADANRDLASELARWIER